MTSAPCEAQRPVPAVRFLGAQASGSLCPEFGGFFEGYRGVDLNFGVQQELRAESPLRCTLTVDLELAPGLHTETVELLWLGHVTPFATNASALVLTTKRHVEGGSGARAEASYRIVNDDFDQSTLSINFVEYTRLAPDGCLAAPTKVRLTTELLAELSGPVTPGQRVTLRSGRLNPSAAVAKPCVPDTTARPSEVIP